MAIDPQLLNIKPISEITTVDNPTEGHFLFYDGSDELKKVDIVKFKLDNKIEQLYSAISNLQNDVNNLPIGAISDIALFGIKQQKNYIQSEYQDVYSRYLIIHNDAALINKLPLTDAFASYYNAYNSLISYFDSAFNDSVITQAEKNELTARFTAYKNQVSLFATALQKAVQAIQEQKIDNIQIGGRNLLKKSQGEFKPNLDTIDNFAHYNETVVYLEQGTQYTLSGKTNGVFSNVHDASVESDRCVIWLINFETNSHIKISDTNTGNKGTVFTWNYPSGVCILRVNVYHPNSTNTIKCWEVKVEKGNKATDWTPAPEDVEASILQSKTDSIAAAKAYADAQDALRKTEAAAYADGVVTAAEQRSITDATNKAEAAKTYATAQDALLKTQLEAYADGIVDAEEQARINQAQSNLNAAKAYADAQDALAKIAANAYADGVVSEEEARAIADATAKMEAAKNHAQGLINNLQIGGRNLIKGSRVDSLVLDTDSRFIFWKELTENLKVGETYIFSSKNKTRPLPELKLSKAEHDYTEGQSITEGVPFVAQFPSKSVRSYKYAGGGDYYIEFIKLEKGNKSTDWTPAPEDVDSAISTAQNSANTANSLLSDIANDNILTPYEKQSAKKEWDIIVSEKTTVETQATSLGVSATLYNSAYNSLNTYITPLLSDLTTNSTIDGATFRAKFKAYYDAKISLLKDVTDKLKFNTDSVNNQINVEAQKIIALEGKTNFLGNTTIDGNAVATGTLLVGNSDGTNAGITGLGNTSDGVYLWGGGTYQQMVQGLAKKEQRRNGIDIWRHPNGQIGFEIGIKDGRLIFNGYHSSGFKLFELDPNRGLVNVAYTQESWTETPLRKLSYSSSTFNESTIASEIQGFISKDSQINYITPNPYSPDPEFVLKTTYVVTQNAIGYDYDNGTNPVNSAYESLKGMKANDNDRNTNIANGWYMSNIGKVYSKIELNQDPPSTYTFTVYVYYYQDGKITQTKVVTITK